MDIVLRTAEIIGNFRGNKTIWTIHSLKVPFPSFPVLKEKSAF